MLAFRARYAFDYIPISSVCFIRANYDVNSGARKSGANISTGGLELFAFLGVCFFPR
jgi:hypothetical protein